METYTRSSEQAAKIITHTFSTSFSASTRLLHRSIRADIYNIYGLVRIADEIVDTYQGGDAAVILEELEAEVYRAIKTGFSANIVVHAFAQTARRFKIQKKLIRPFFASMHMDLKPRVYTSKTYREYIHGSAEVVGLMCLQVFVNRDEQQYNRLSEGAVALGSAFQKVNFLRDIQEDSEVRGRYYFPIGNYGDFDNATKDLLLQDIAQDFEVARLYINRLPLNARAATRLAYTYYRVLEKKLRAASPITLKSSRIRVNNFHKLALYILVRIGMR